MNKARTAATKNAPRAATATPDVSIVIVSWNSERWIERCVASIAPAAAGVSYDVKVYDNASSDATTSVVEAMASSERRLQLIRGNENEGFAAATNKLVSVTKGKYVLLLNPDCELEPAALSWLVRFLDANPEAAVAAPLLHANGESQREFQLRRLPTLGSLAMELLLIDKLWPSNPVSARYRYRELELREPQPIEQPAAAALLIRRTVFEQVGPFDERFSPAWFEDVDFCRRLAERGESAWVVPAARAEHFGGSSLETIQFAGFTDIWYRNMNLYARKWFTRGEAELVRWMVIAGMLLRIGAATLGAPLGAPKRSEAIAAYAAVIRKALGRWDNSSPSSS